MSRIDVLVCSCFLLASPQPTVQSFYTSELTNNSLSVCGTDDCSDVDLFYYQPIGIMSLTSDVYILESVGIISNYGYIFNSTVRRITNLTRSTAVWGDQRGWGSLFPITVAVRAMLNYTLVFSTYLTSYTGPISITALGNSPLIFTSLWLWRRMNKIDESLITHLTFDWLAECLLLLFRLHKYPWSIFLNHFFFVCALFEICRIVRRLFLTLRVSLFTQIKQGLFSVRWILPNRNSFPVDLIGTVNRPPLSDHDRNDWPRRNIPTIQLIFSSLHLCEDRTAQILHRMISMSI